MSKIFTKPFRPLDWASSPHDFTGDNQLGPHTSETTQRYIYGTRFLTWDGKVYKYSLSSGACYTTMGNVFFATITSDTNGIDYSALTNGQSAGDREITLTNGSTAVAEDYLAGGLAVIIPSESTTNAEVMLRGIIGNNAAVATSGECTIYLDYPLETAVTTSENAYAMPSHYSNIKYQSTSGKKSFSGIAGTYVSATGYNFWTQTYGVCQLVNGWTEVCGKTAYYRGVWWRHDGSVSIFDNAPDAQTDLCAGFVLDNNADDNGMTNIMMTVSY